MQVEGYVECRCGNLMPHTPLRPAPPFCDDCRLERLAALEEARLVYEVEGRRLTTKKKPDRRRRRKKPPPSPDALEARRARDRAKQRAYVRLGEVHRPMFEMLYAEELLREGQPPEIRRYAPRPRAVADRIDDDLAEAGERMTRRRQGQSA